MLLFQLPETLDWRLDSSGVWMAYPQSGGIAPGFEEIVEAGERLVGARALNLMVNKIPPGIIVPVHRDWTTSGIVARYHYPLDDGVIWEEGHYGIMRAGKWYGPVRYWKRHAVANLSDRDRINIVIDFDLRMEGSHDD